MPMHNGWLPREGITADPVIRLLKRTAFNPVATLLLILLARYTKRGSDLAILHETAFARIRKLFYFGLFRWVSGFLDSGVLNNWVKDEYHWEKEVVLVTGASNVHYYKCDITSPATIAKIAAEVRKDVGNPTIIINNAGVARGKNILDATEKDVRFTFDVNTFAHYWLAKEFVPSMVQSNHGMIVIVASIAAFVTVPNMTDYAASKAAAHSFHEGLAAELKTRYNAPKVRTIIVNQGYTKTPLFEGFSNDATFLNPPLEPETVAEAIVKKVLSGSSGQVILPEIGSNLTLFRGMPHWYQTTVRSKGEKMMKNWDGRQVIDVEKRGSGGEKEGESESTVLVPPVAK
ncbi:hypothetical protein HYALB_00013121 [Hymenoscyphus albidus]|uniref:Short-chain dehydrogenase/reductase 3 n=1 Tax=Hymenoscyphus albidus TaxID=595503 RepID=A0A9N9LWP6_9HELO|nr:hypothetical protein HYALB_00013121 [Hymenoscyphus albidus]